MVTTITGLPLPDLLSDKAHAELLPPIAVPCFEVDVNQPKTIHLENDRVWKTGKGRKTQVGVTYPEGRNLETEL